MTKVKILAYTDGVRLENDINLFIADKKVIDIKYEALLINDESGNGSVNDRVLIIYEEELK
jgi:hypothetical protein